VTITIREEADAALCASKDAQQDALNADVKLNHARVAFEEAVLARYVAGERFKSARAHWVTVADAADAADRKNNTVAAIASSCKGAPSITADSSELALMEWLAWNDPNGEWDTFIAKVNGDYDPAADPSCADYDERHVAYLADAVVPSMAELWRLIADMVGE
jgi:hypothetical protein